MTTAEKSYTFKAEIKQLLDILVHSLYKERDIFLRELISNASDALTRLQFEMLTNSDIVDPEAELAIHIEIIKPDEGEGEKAPAKLVIKDSGIGMTRAELIENLGTIAQSGARAFLGKLREVESAGDVGEVIGQFGVGFYSVFMAAQEVRVISRSYQPEAEAAVWISDGGETYQVEAADKQDRGTEIHIILREEAAEFADEWKLKQVIKKHSDFVAYPIYVGEEQANQQQSLWRKQPSEVEEDAYKSFYQQMTLDFDEPLSTIHFSSDAPLNVRAMLFIPGKREKTMFNKRTEPGLMLYSKNVLIQEYCTDLLPRWLGFVDGVVDSEDLPLNVSRETIQNTRVMRQLEKTISKRVLRELKRMGNDAEKYAQFWREFGRFFKEGLAVDPSAKEDIMPLLRFYSSKSDGELISLETYLERLPEEQSEIYYVLGDDVKSVANSPHLDPFKARDLEVLYFVDAFDAFMAPALTEFNETPFKNVDDPNLNLPEEGEASDEESEEEATPAIEEADFNRVVGRFVTVLGERASEVRSSKVLRNSPLRLVSPEGGPNQAMHRLNRYLDQDYEIPQKIVELNPKHPLLANLATILRDEPDSRVIDLIVEQLYMSALVQEGLHPNPADMLPRVQELMEIATQR